MAYSDYTLSEIKEKFQLAIEEQTNIFTDNACIGLKYIGH